MNYKGENLFYTIIGGSVGGMSSLTLTYPTEYIKTKLQFNSDNGKNGFFKLLENEMKKPNGFKKLYRGYVPTLFSILPRSGINFMTYEYVYFNLKKDGDSRIIQIVKNFGSGMIAGIVSSSLFATPIENIKTGMIYYETNGKKIRMDEIIKELGFKRLFLQGALPTIIKESTTYGTRFFIYTEMLNLLNKKNFIKENGKMDYNKNKKSINIIGASIMAGCISCIVNNPLDVIQTRLQIPNQIEKSMFKISKDIYKKEGLKTFYKGCLIRIMRTTPAVCVSFGVYEMITSFLLSNF